MEVVPQKRRPFSTLEKIEMKKTLVALAAVSAVAAFAQTTDGKPGFQVQGLFSGGYQANSWAGVKVSGIDQNATGTSQINFRGLEDLGGGNAAYFRIENDISFMNNAQNTGVLPTYASSTATTVLPGTSTAVGQTTLGRVGTFANSEVLGGVRGSFGDVAFGQIHNMGLLWIQSVAAPVQGTSFGGGYGMVLGADPTLLTTRWANSFRYITPTVNGFTGSFINAFKQNSATVPVAATGLAITNTSLGVGLNNQVGAQELGLKYANGPLTAALVTNKTSLDSFCAAPSSTTTVAGSSAANPCLSVLATGLTTNAAISTGQDNKQTSLAASYALPAGLTASGAYQKTTLGAVGTTMAGSQSERVATLYTLTYATGVHTAFATIGNVKENASLATKNGFQSKFAGLGYNYALSKNTALTARWETFQDDILIITKYQASKDYSSLQGTNGTDNRRTRTGFGLHMAF